MAPTAFVPPEPLPAWLFPTLGVTGVVAAVLLIPFPRSVAASVVLEAPDAVVVAAPRDVQVKAAPVANGKWIEPGAVLLTLDTSDDATRLKPFDTRITLLQTQLVETQRAISKKQIGTWQKTVKRLEKEAEIARAAVAKAEGGPAKKLAPLQKKAADKERELVEARAELEDATKVDALAKLKEELAAATAAREKASAEDAVLRAPAAGFVIDLTASPGQRINSGATLARIADSHALVVTCTLDTNVARFVEPGQTLAVNVKGHALPLTVETVDGTRATAKLTQDGKPELIAGDSGDATIRVRARSLLGRLF